MDEKTIYEVAEEKPNYYAIIPAEVRYDKKLKDKAKLLYGEISALSNKDGYCFASNRYFAELYGISTTTVSTLIKNLIDRGYISSEIIYKGGTQEILNRYLKIFKDPYLKKFKEGIKENLKDNNTSINNTSINNIPPIIPQKGNNSFLSIISETDFLKDNEPLTKRIKEWLEYKKQRKDKPYTEIGFKKLLKQIENNTNTYGEQKIMDLIDECMSNNYQGIIFDKLQKLNERKTKQQLLDEEMEKWVREGDKKHDKNGS